MPIIAYSTILLFVSTSLPPIPTATLQKYFTTIRRFFLTYYRWCVRLAKVVEEGNVIFSWPVRYEKRTTKTSSASYGSGYSIARRLVNHRTHTYARIMSNTNKQKSVRPLSHVTQIRQSERIEKLAKLWGCSTREASKTIARMAAVQAYATACKAEDTI